MSKKNLFTAAALVGVGTLGLAFARKVYLSTKEVYLREKVDENILKLRDDLGLDVHVHDGKIRLYKSVPQDVDGEMKMTPVVFSVDDLAVGRNKIMMVKKHNKWLVLNTATMMLQDYIVDDFKWVEETNSDGTVECYLLIYQEDLDTCLKIKDSGAVKSRHNADYFGVKEEPETEEPEIKINVVE